MTWKCRWCGHTTIWWKGACSLCGVPLPGERRRRPTAIQLGVMLAQSFEAAAEFQAQMDKVELIVKRVPVLDTGIGQALGYADDKAFLQAASEEREKAMALLSVDERARIEAAERELERRIIWGDGT